MLKYPTKQLLACKTTIENPSMQLLGPLALRVTLTPKPGGRVFRESRLNPKPLYIPYKTP